MKSIGLSRDIKSLLPNSVDKKLKISSIFDFFFFTIILFFREVFLFSHCSLTNKTFFFQAEDGIRDAQESRGLGDVYKRQIFY